MDEGLPMWTIYSHPSDYPGGYVVRRGVAYASGYVPDKVAQYAPTLEAAIRLLPPGLYPLGRQPDDDPVIVGVWV
jgi:hypothetical protein